jgi:hypothetical protein
MDLGGWLASFRIGHLSETISVLTRSSSSELRDAILEIENADPQRVPKGLLPFLARVAWDSPASPDLSKFLSARKRGLSVRDSLFDCQKHTSEQNW